MNDIRDASGVSLKRLYRLFPAKEELVVAVLKRRDVWWRRQLAAHVERHQDPEARILAVFDWLEAWFAEPGFPGCAWINFSGELGAVSTSIAEQALRHKTEFTAYLGRLVTTAGLPRELADSLVPLAEGAIATAGTSRTTAAASQARGTVRTLINDAKRQTPAAPSRTVR